MANVFQHKFPVNEQWLPVMGYKPEQFDNDDFCQGVLKADNTLVLYVNGVVNEYPIICNHAYIGLLLNYNTLAFADDNGVHVHSLHNAHEHITVNVDTPLFIMANRNYFMIIDNNMFCVNVGNQWHAENFWRNAQAIIPNVIVTSLPAQGTMLQVQLTASTFNTLMQLVCHHAQAPRLIDGKLMLTLNDKPIVIRGFTTRDNKHNVSFAVNDKSGWAVSNIGQIKYVNCNNLRTLTATLSRMMPNSKLDRGIYCTSTSTGIALKSVLTNKKQLITKDSAIPVFVQMPTPVVGRNVCADSGRTLTAASMAYLTTQRYTQLQQSIIAPSSRVSSSRRINAELHAIRVVYTARDFDTRLAVVFTDILIINGVFTQSRVITYALLATDGALINVEQISLDKLTSTSNNVYAAITTNGTAGLLEQLNISDFVHNKINNITRFKLTLINHDKQKTQYLPAYVNALIASAGTQVVVCGCTSTEVLVANGKTIHTVTGITGNVCWATTYDDSAWFGVADFALSVTGDLQTTKLLLPHGCTWVTVVDNQVWILIDDILYPGCVNGTQLVITNEHAYKKPAGKLVQLLQTENKLIAVIHDGTFVYVVPLEYA